MGSYASGFPRLQLARGLWQQSQGLGVEGVDIDVDELLYFPRGTPLLSLHVRRPGSSLAAALGM